MTNLIVCVYVGIYLLGKMLVVLGVLCLAYIGLMTAFWFDYKSKGGKRTWWAYIKHATNSKW